MNITCAYNAKMNLETLTIFLEVTQQLSFSTVAKTRNVAPSSISRTISNLEKELEIKLFQRSTRKLTPTEAGFIYFERVSSALVELDDAMQVAKDLSNEPRGTLRITASTVFGKMYIAPMLAEFLKKYPLVKIELILTDTYIDLIEERIDIAIRLGSLQDSSYIAKKLSQMNFYICASPDYIKINGKPTKPDQIKEHNCLLFPRTGYPPTWLIKDRSHTITEVTTRGNCTVTNSEAIKECAISGVGLALLPDWLVNNDIKNKYLVKLLESYEVTATDYDSAIWVLYPSRNYLPLKTRVFIDHLVLKLEKQLLWQ